MSAYHPPASVAQIAALFHGEPIAHAEKPDGSIVIVMRDGRKLTYKPGPVPEAPAARASRKAKAK